MPAHLISLPATPGRAGGNKRAILSLNLANLICRKSRKVAVFPRLNAVQTDYYYKE